MRPSFESIMADSFDDLKSLQNRRSEIMTDNDPEMFISSDDLEAAKQRSAEAAVAASEEEFDVDTFVEENEIQHRRLEKDISEVREMVGTMRAAMEMMSTVTSMESLTDDSIVMVNTALDNIANVSGGAEAPVIEVVDGRITDASMESLVDFIVTALRKLKAWIKEKWSNIVLSFQRSNTSDVMTGKRFNQVQNKLHAFGSDYGIPAKPIKYNPKMTAYMYRDKSAVPMVRGDLKKAIEETKAYAAFANSKLAGDAADRSSMIVEDVGKVLMSRDGIDAEKILKNILGKLAGNNPSEGFVEYNKELMGGVTFIDPRAAAPRPSRDVEWIAAAHDYLNIPFGRCIIRQTGNYPTQAVPLEQLMDALEVGIELFESDEYRNNNWYNEIGGAWQDAYRMYDRLVATVNTVHLPHMSNELWRAVDLACTGMFSILERAYWQIIYMRAPAYRTIHGILYVAEEQAKAYAAVNR